MGRCPGPVAVTVPQRPRHYPPVLSSRQSALRRTWRRLFGMIAASIGASRTMAGSLRWATAVALQARQATDRARARARLEARPARLRAGQRFVRNWWRRDRGRDSRSTRVEESLSKLAPAEVYPENARVMFRQACAHASAGAAPFYGAARFRQVARTPARAFLCVSRRPWCAAWAVR